MFHMGGSSTEGCFCGGIHSMFNDSGINCSHCTCGLTILTRLQAFVKDFDVGSYWCSLLLCKEVL